MFLTKARLMTGFLALSLATSALIGTALARGGRGGGGYGRSSMSRGYSSYPAGAPRSYNSHSYSNSNLHPTNPFAPGATNLGAGGSNASPTTNVKPIQLGPGRNLGASSASKISQTGKLQPGVGAGHEPRPKRFQDVADGQSRARRRRTRSKLGVECQQDWSDKLQYPAKDLDIAAGERNSDDPEDAAG
jgi:hypothetical protein